MRQSKGSNGACGTAFGPVVPEDAAAGVFDCGSWLVTFRKGLFRGSFGCALLVAGAGKGALTGAGAEGWAGATAAKKLCTWGICCATWGICCATSSVAN